MNYNLSKGEDLFFKEINRLSSLQPVLSENIKYLASMFSGKVGIMQEGNLKELKFENEDELIFSLNAIPSYKKLAYCVYHSALNCKSENYKDILLFILDSYKNADYKDYLKSESSTTDEKLNNAFNSEIENSFNHTQNLVSYEIVNEDEQGNFVQKVLDLDSIDLIEDFDDEDLTIEGLRSLGVVDSNFDTSIYENVEISKSRNNIPNGKLEIDVQGNPVIICPFTGSSDVYQIDSNTYASFETDQPFRIVFNLADLK